MLPTEVVGTWSIKGSKYPYVINEWSLMSLDLTAENCWVGNIVVHSETLCAIKCRGRVRYIKFLVHEIKFHQFVKQHLNFCAFKSISVGAKQPH